METRQLLDEEINYLKNFYESSVGELFGRAFLLIIALFGLSAFCYGAIKFIAKKIMPILNQEWTQDYKNFLFLFILTITIIVGLKWGHMILKSELKFRKLLREILSHNQAEVHNLSIVRAAQLEEFEDEGVGFFLETDQGNVLFVNGQDLYDYALDFEEDDPYSPAAKPYGEVFPSTKLSFIRESSKGIRLNLIASGDKIIDVPMVTGKDFFWENSKDTKYYGPEDGSFYEGSLESVLASFSIELKEEIKT
jgi:hypothetical protein